MARYWLRAPAAPLGAADAGEVGEGAERGRKGALAGVVELPGLGHQLAADHADPRLRPQSLQGRVEGARIDLGVGVEQQHRLGLALTQGQVVGGGEADVAPAQQPHPGNSRSTMSGRRVGAAAVDDGHPHRHTRRRLALSEAQAAPQQPFGTVADDDDFEIHPTMV